MKPVIWSEKRIALALLNASPALAASILVVPNCSWAGWEADLLVIEKGLRIIEVEIKISRADLKHDLKKDKWWTKRPWSRNKKARIMLKEPVRREWPEKVWKHYYAMPEEIWKPELESSIPETSGIIVVVADARYSWGHSARVIRRAKPNPKAKPICPADAIDIARLASLRMWSAIRKDLI